MYTEEAVTVSRITRLRSKTYSLWVVAGVQQTTCFKESCVKWETKEFQEALRRSVKEMAERQFDRKTIFDVGSDKVRRVPHELSAQKRKTPHQAGFHTYIRLRCALRACTWPSTR